MCEKKKRITINKFCKDAGFEVVKKVEKSPVRTGQYHLSNGRDQIWINYGWEDGSVTATGNFSGVRIVFTDTNSLTDMYESIIKYLYKQEMRN